MAKGAQQQEEAADDGPIDFSGGEGTLLGEGQGEEGAQGAPEGASAEEGAAAGKKGSEEDDGKGSMVPSHRLRQATERATEVERENAFLKGQLAARDQQNAASTAKKEDAAPKVDLDKLEDELYEANQTGNRPEAIRISRAIREETTRQATIQATAVAEARFAERVAAQEQGSLEEVVEQVVSQYPMLDSNGPEKDQTTIDMVMGVRARLERQNVRPAVALSRAVREVTTKLGIAKENAKAPAANPGQVRDKQALARAGDASRRQPERASGIGARSGAAGGPLSEEQIRGIGNTRAERNKMFAGEIPGMDDEA